VSRCTCAAIAACLPLSNRPGSPSLGFIHRRFRLRITAGYICGKRSAHLCAVAAWCVDNSGSFSVHKAWIALSQVKALLRARPGNTIPSISPMCAQARRRFTQVIHMVVHSKAGNTFSCRPAGSSAPACRRLRDTTGKQDADLAWAWMASPTTVGTGCSRQRGTQSCGLALRRSCTGLLPGAAALSLTASGPARPPENLACARPDLRSSRAAFPHLPGCLPWQRRSCRAKSGKAPPCMRWRGPARPRRARPAS